jgi:hypothetical protein
MKPSLNQSELDQLLFCKLHNKLMNEELTYLCDLADNWTAPIGALTYLLARIFEGHEEKNSSV